jgi:hypothetical protein
MNNPVKVGTADKVTVLSPSTNTASSSAGVTATTTFGGVGYGIDQPIRTVGLGTSSRDVENAVYSHIRAVRALGRTKINSLEIAKALQLSLPMVQQALEKLADKGVKVVE